MEIAEILKLFDAEQRIDITFPDMTKETMPGIVRFVRPKPGMSFILYSSLTEDTVDSVIEEQLADLKGRDLHFEWKVFGHDWPTDLGDRLAALGLEGEEPEAIMVLELAGAPPSLLQPVDADIRKLTSPSELTDVEKVLTAVWGGNFGWVHERIGGHMAIPDYVSVYVGYVDNEPANVGWTYFGEGQFASLWGGSTLEAMRGRGLYTALLAARVQEAIARGRQFVTVDAGPMSQPIVARHGFRELTTAAAYEWNGES